MIISPKTKVGELLDIYPQLESVLMEMSPAFEKLKNPILRKTVARVATLQQIAVVGGLSVDTIVNRLREEVGQETMEEENSTSEYLSNICPEWFAEKAIVKRFDASALINSGGSPMNEILHQANELGPGEIFELKTPFLPAPILDILTGKNFRVWCKHSENDVICYINKM
jgi:hypothetical protein